MCFGDTASHLFWIQERNVLCVSPLWMCACAYLRASEPLSWTPKWEAVRGQNLLSTKLPCSVECLENYLIIHNNERLKTNLCIEPLAGTQTHLVEMLLSLEWKSVQQFTSGPRLSFTLLRFHIGLSFVLWFFNFHKSFVGKEVDRFTDKVFSPYLNTARNQM